MGRGEWGVGGLVRKCRTSSHHGRDGMGWDRMGGRTRET